METYQRYCPTCFHTITEVDYFCPFCGKQLKEKPLPTTRAKQLSIYALSFFVPPFGLWPAVKYLKAGTSETKRIGIIALLLTIVSIGLSIYFLTGVVNTVNQEVSKQLDQGILGY